MGKPAPFRAEGSVHTMAENTPGDMSEAQFLTIAEVAAKMRVSKMTVYRLVHAGENLAGDGAAALDHLARDGELLDALL